MDCKIKYSCSKPPIMSLTDPGETENPLPEDVRMGESIHELHLFQQVCPVTAQLVHLESHHLTRSSVSHLGSKSKNVKGGSYI